MKWLIKNPENNDLHNGSIIELPDALPDHLPITISYNKKPYTIFWDSKLRICKIKNGNHFVHVRLNKSSIEFDKENSSWFLDETHSLGGQKNFLLHRQCEFYSPLNNNKNQNKKNKAKSIFAPMTGKVLKLFATEEQKISAGETILIIEAMKMENKISAKQDALVAEIKIKEGDVVQKGDLLVKFKS